MNAGGQKSLFRLFGDIFPFINIICNILKLSEIVCLTIGPYKVSHNNYGYFPASSQIIAVIFNT